MWNTVRLTTYIAAFLALLAGLAAMGGWGTYDAATGLFDPHPISIPQVAGIISAGLANGMAAIAVWRKWGKD
jgi:hypothetical protein